MWYRLIAPPTVETHGECVIRLFLRDGSGASVPNARVKLWAGPPPNGLPVRLNDDYPYRTTNSSGMLEFVAHSGRMPETRDYWAQLLANDGSTMSDPIQFHFPQASALWIMATVQATESGGAGAPLPSLQWDPRLTAMNISIAPAAGVSPGQPFWKIVSAEYQDETQSAGSHHLSFTTLDTNGRPMAGVPVQLDFEGRAPNDVPPQVYSDGSGMASYGLYSGPTAWNPRLGPGPYSAWVGDPDLRGRNRTGIPGERFAGAGLPMSRQVNFLVTWQKVILAGAGAASSISGTITNALSGTHVTLTSPETTVSTTLDGEGTYAFHRLSAGTYSISATGAGVIASNIVLDGTPNGTARVDYTFPAPSVKRGSKVVGVVQNAAPNLQVELASTNQSFTANVDSAGRFSFANVPAGTYDLSIAGLGVAKSNLVVDGVNTATVNHAVPGQAGGKVLNHYLLFGPPNLSATRTNLILALDYIARFAPTVGFSLEEAKGAQNVTIVGSGATSGADEQTLIRSGCTVRRLAAADSYGMDQLFTQLIASGNPYPGA